MLICSIETDTPFDVFAIRECNTEGNTVGHLPCELSKVTKFLLIRGAAVATVLTEMHYRRSRARELEIPCLVKVEMHPTLKNIQLLD